MNYTTSYTTSRYTVKSEQWEVKKIVEAFWNTSPSCFLSKLHFYSMPLPSVVEVPCGWKQNQLEGSTHASLHFTELTDDNNDALVQTHGSDDCKDELLRRLLEQWFYCLLKHGTNNAQLTLCVGRNMLKCNSRYLSFLVRKAPCVIQANQANTRGSVSLINHIHHYFSGHKSIEDLFQLPAVYHACGCLCSIPGTSFKQLTHFPATEQRQAIKLFISINALNHSLPDRAWVYY